VNLTTFALPTCNGNGQAHDKLTGYYRVAEQLSGCSTTNEYYALFKTDGKTFLKRGAGIVVRIPQNDMWVGRIGTMTGKLVRADQRAGIAFAGAPVECAEAFAPVIEGTRKRCCKLYRLAWRRQGRALSSTAELQRRVLRGSTAV